MAALAEAEDAVGEQLAQFAYDIEVACFGGVLHHGFPAKAHPCCMKMHGASYTAVNFAVAVRSDGNLGKFLKRVESMGTSGDHDVQITYTDLAAADELYANTEFASAEEREEQRRRIAYFHARWGDRKFRVRYGLMAPGTRFEAIEAEYYQGRISIEEFKERFTNHANRLADRDMLNEIVTALEERLGHYAGFMQSLMEEPGVTPAQSLRRVNREARAMSDRISITGEEFDTARQFLTEARVRRGLSLATAREFKAASAIELAWTIVDGAAKLWKQAKWIAHLSQTTTRFDRAMTARDLFSQSTHYSSLPLPSELRALLREEHVIGKLALEARDQKSAIPCDLAEANRHLHSASGNPCELGFAPASSPSNPCTPSLVVESWEELALAIDEKKRVWAISPPPASGDVFLKNKSIRIAFRKGDRFALLTSLANSTTGCSVDIAVVASALGLLPPPSSMPIENRARRESLIAGYCEGLTNDGGKLRKKLNEVMSDLGARIREFVTGPVGKGNSALSIDDNYVTSGFIVRYLYQDENRHLRFGIKPTS